MDGQRFLTSLHLKNLLSYGPNSEKIDLQPLNVLIGPNASGKSNFIEAIELLRATAGNIAGRIYEGGGMAEYSYKGSFTPAPATVICSAYHHESGINVLHKFTVAPSNQKIQIVDETIEPVDIASSREQPEFFYQYNQQNPVAYVPDIDRTQGSVAVSAQLDRIFSWKRQSLTGLQSDASVLAQRTDPDLYPELNFLAARYKAIKIYRNFVMEGPNSIRWPQRSDLPNDFLEESGRNLSLIVNNLAYQGAMDKVIEKMKTVYGDIEDITAKIEGGTVQTYIRERGMREPIPAGRLSDGTLRFLCLLVILYHPTPPPLICIEEPELGLHPDVIPTIAEMLIEASSRTQLVVTTHSDLLISKLGDIPEAVVVCERTDQGSVLRRLEKDKLDVWLENYSLGDLWLRGEIGGTRW
ncbi:chromosome segregation protein SMC [Capsulimonas corticalis]|uniref:Chromosome segregation protein SMC n=1 Tax=Capsulimonas corticalis TaxID=2219043 RepID=A0A402CNQ4_9BACT|nr:AAA family ATPase [Capsulimonas corticalis]BDI33231.1 chromosome segregation protein SMC [Capsulimonas corticalis]